MVESRNRRRSFRTSDKLDIGSSTRKQRVAGGCMSASRVTHNASYRRVVGVANG